MKTLFRNLLPLFLAFGVAGAATAAPAQPADEVIKKATTEFQAMVAANHEAYNADLPGFYKVVDEKLVPYFDTHGIAQLVLGKNWRAATPEQRRRFEAAFKDSLIRTYARAMLDYYDSVRAEWTPLRAAPDADDVTVNAKLIRKDAPPIALAFNLHTVDNQWKVYDIAVENLSLVTNFRSQISAEVKANGLDAVIEKFEENTYFSQAKAD